MEWIPRHRKQERSCPCHKHAQSIAFVWDASSIHTTESRLYFTFIHTFVKQSIFHFIISLCVLLSLPGRAMILNVVFSVALLAIYQNIFTNTDFESIFIKRYSMKIIVKLFTDDWHFMRIYLFALITYLQPITSHVRWPQ